MNIYWKGKCKCCGTEKCRGPTGSQGERGSDGKKGSNGSTGDVGQKGPVGNTGCVGDPGPVGEMGYQGITGQNGSVGSPGVQGPVGLPGEKGADGKDGIDGQNGLPGSIGSVGPMGPKGPTGNNGAPGTIGIESIYLWSTKDQNLRQVNHFQYVEFDKSPIGPEDHIWTLTSEPGYSNPTTFICAKAGHYLLFFKLDIFAGNSPTSEDINPTECVSAACIFINGIEAGGSCSVVEAPEERHVYSCSNQILVNLKSSDKVTLVWWSTDAYTTLGNSVILQGILPNGKKATQCCASFVIVRVA
jgi:hypothetical protein